MDGDGDGGQRAGARARWRPNIGQVPDLMLPGRCEQRLTKEGTGV